MDFGGKKNKNEDFEVTGVSRSGRVRKKSSKLMDFESDDVEKPKRQSVVGVVNKKPENVGMKKLEDSVMKPEFDYDDTPSQDSESDFEAEHYNELHMGASSESMDESHSDDDDDHPGAFRRIEDIEPEVAPPLFTPEKNAKKRVVIKDGKVVTNNKPKTPRKEKGKAKLTAYMLWARGARARLVNETPKLDFAAISRRLSEMWSMVTTGERDAWQRRAKRLNTTATTLPTPQRQFTGNADAMRNRNASNNKFISNSGAGGPQKSAAAAGKGAGKATTYQLGMPTLGNTVSPESPRSKDAVKIGIKPIDVAAHLKLLGESLTIIGERLKEHEGQIAVSGSLSVLLDSLLCSLGPLLCLTQFIPELQERCVTPEQLTKIVDNVAFIMPGL